MSEITESARADDRWPVTSTARPTTTAEGHRAVMREFYRVTLAELGGQRDRAVISAAQAQRSARLAQMASNSIAASETRWRRTASAIHNMLFGDYAFGVLTLGLAGLLCWMVSQPTPF